MPLKLIEPRKGKTPYWSVRGTYLGRHVDRSTKTGKKSVAAKLLKQWEIEIERGQFPTEGRLTFAGAALAYMQAGGEREYLDKILEHRISPDDEHKEWRIFGNLPVEEVDQLLIDRTAAGLYPTQTAATRNRQAYTPISAVLKHAGFEKELKRPKGWRGEQRTEWMEPDQAFRLLNAAREVDLEFGIFLCLLLYTGPRLSEACRLTCDKVNLQEAFAYIGTTKNGLPRPVHFPPALVAALANHPRGLDRRKKNGTGEKVFRFVKCGRLYTLMSKAKKAAGPDLSFVTFHIFCHTWATWMRRYAGLDVHGLVATERWKDPASAARYTHVVASEESRRSDLLPTENSWKARGQTGKGR